MSRTQVSLWAQVLDSKGAEKEECRNVKALSLAVHICGKDSVSFCNLFISLCISCCSVFSCFLQVVTACQLN